MSSVSSGLERAGLEHDRPDQIRADDRGSLPFDTAALQTRAPATEPVRTARRLVLNELAGLYGLAPGATLSAWIDGAAAPGEGQPIPLIDPATGDEILRYPDAGQRLAVEAGSASVPAQQEWTMLPAAERARRMLGWAQAVRDTAADLAILESANTGRPLAWCEADVARVIDTIEHFAGWCDKPDGSATAEAGLLTAHAMTPLGTVLVLMSWQNPLLTAVRHAAPALAAGNAVILKPGAATPLSALVLGQLASEGGLPRGLLQIVPGLGASTGGALAVQDAVRKVVVAGHTSSAMRVARLCAERLKPCQFDLAGNTNVVLLQDAAMDLALPALLRAGFGLDGYPPGARLFVARDRYRDTVSMLFDMVRLLRPGLPLEPESQLGPAVSPRRLEQAQALVSRAVAEGARQTDVKLPAGLPPGGHWMPPTLLWDLPRESVLLREPVFAPVLSVFPIDDGMEALRHANAGTDRDLSIWTRDLGQAQSLAGTARADRIWINALDTAAGLSGRDMLAQFTCRRMMRFGS